MSRTKKIFLILAVLFFILLFYASYDISKRTTFPGSKPQLKERIQKDILFSDTVKRSKTPVLDTIPVNKK